MRAPTTYVIEHQAEGWVLRRLGEPKTMVVGPTIEYVSKQAFLQLRLFAPCTLRIVGDDYEEWRLRRANGTWELMHGPG